MFSRPLNRVTCSSETKALDLSAHQKMSLIYDHVSGAHVYQIFASTTHGVDIYERVFNSLFGASVVGSSEESIFPVRTPNYLVLFPGYAEYQALVGRNNFSNFWIFLICLKFFLFSLETLETGMFSRPLNSVTCSSETKALDLSGH